MTRQILTRLHFKVDVASDGNSAVAKYQQLINTVRVILMDIGLPGISGIEATELIRKYEQSEEGQRRRGGLPPVSIYGLTANVNKENLAEYERAGLNGCIFKGDNIAQAVQQIINQSQKKPGVFVNLTEQFSGNEENSAQPEIELNAAAAAGGGAGDGGAGSSGDGDGNGIEGRGDGGREGEGEREEQGEREGEREGEGEEGC
jgi:CheY-like chemotaxis protein